MKHLLLTIAIVAFSLSQLVAQNQNKQLNKTDTMNRIERTEKTYKELFGQNITASKTDPELMTILQRFIFGEVFYAGDLDIKTRELITITTLTVNQTLPPQLKAHTNAALNVGVKPIEIRESIYQLAPFIGFPKVLNALDTINSVFESRNIPLPLQSEGTVKEDVTRAKEVVQRGVSSILLRMVGINICESMSNCTSARLFSGRECTGNVRSPFFQ